MANQAPDQLSVIEQILKRHIRETNLQNQRVNEFIVSQSVTNETLIESVDVIKRAVYGDEKNDVPGLLDRTKNTEDTVRSLKTRNSKYVWWATGAIAGLNFAIYFVKELFTHK